mgnify:CR=1 FL=1
MTTGENSSTMNGNVRSGGHTVEEKYMNIIKAVNLVFDYIRRDEEGQVEEVKRALDHVNLEIEKGSFVAILGHNGSGKSTFAKQINGILSPTDGTLFVSEMDTRDEAHLWDIRKNAGMVFQNPDNQIIGNIVEEDVGFGPENIGVPTEEIWKRVDESLKAVGMTMYRKQSVHELNRVEGITMVLITHYMEEVVDADRVIVMDDGHIVMDGTPKEIFSRVEELKQYRMDVPQVTELAWELKKKGIPLPDGILRKSELLDALVPLLKEE